VTNTFSDGAQPELRERLAEESAVKVAVFDSGMASGQPSVVMWLDLPDGGPV
jgi:hypothetical protein